MKEIEFIGPTMAMEHASFQMFKHVGYQIGIITPKMQMLAPIRRELLFNLKAIDSHSLDVSNESRIVLSNGSQAIFATKYQSKTMLRGCRFNMLFSLYEPLDYETKLDLIPCLATNPNNVLYTVHDR